MTAVPPNLLSKKETIFISPDFEKSGIIQKLEYGAP